MRVYRIEHNVSGYGPFRTGGIDEYYDRYHGGEAIHNESSQYPLPREDGLRIEDDLFCAAKDMDQLRHWFGLENCPAALAEQGYVIRVFEVSPQVVAIGSKQVLFPKHEAELVEQHDCTLLEDV